jgi:hypothetical protein
MRNIDKCSLSRVIVQFVLVRAEVRGQQKKEKDGVALIRPCLDEANLQGAHDNVDVSLANLDGSRPSRSAVS